MELLNKLYRSDCIYIAKDNYGGNTFDIYSYIYIYIENKQVFCFSSFGNIFGFNDKMTSVRLEKELKDSLSGLKEMNDNAISFNLNNGLFLEGYFTKSKKQLILTAKDQNKVLWLNRKFNRIKI